MDIKTLPSHVREKIFRKCDTESLLKLGTYDNSYMEEILNVRLKEKLWFKSAKLGYLNWIKFLADKIEIDCLDISLSRKTALHLSLLNDKFRIAEFLVNKGANVDKLIENRASCIDIVACSSHPYSFKMFKFLLNYTNIPVENSLRCSLYNYRILKYILENYNTLNLNEVQEGYGTVLHEACAECSSQIVKLLIKYGADVNIQNEEGKTPIFYCLENYEKVKALLDSKCDLTIVDLYGVDIFIEAYNEKVSVKIIKLMMKYL